MDQQPDGKKISSKLAPPYGKALGDPATSLTGFGKAKLASHEILETRCYIKDNAIIIKLTVDVKND